jgi:predicted nucleic acid-binding protein
MIVHLDTSVLISAIGGSAAPALRQLIGARHRLQLSAPVLYEWLRGPRTEAELELQDALFPSEEAIAFGAPEANQAALLYSSVKRARGREIDLAIAACAIVHGAALWTGNPRDFSDVPGLRLFSM